jgi:hypothetical protein
MTRARRLRSSCTAWAVRPSGVRVCEQRLGVGRLGGAEVRPTHAHVGRVGRGRAWGSPWHERRGAPRCRTQPTVAPARGARWPRPPLLLAALGSHAGGPTPNAPHSRRAVKSKRDYLGNRKNFSWLYLSRWGGARHCQLARKHGTDARLGGEGHCGTGVGFAWQGHI